MAAFLFLSWDYFSYFGIQVLLRQINLTGLTCRGSLTCLRLHRKVWLSLQYAVHQPGTVAIGGVVSICSCHLHH